MGATYTRQSSYTDGDVIQAADTNNEFDQLLAAFASSSGHTHDGTTAEGGPITKLLGTAITIGDGTAGTDIAVTFDGETTDGVLTWKEDEDYFEFSDDILIASTEKLQFRDTAIYINSSADGQLDLVADTEIQIAATTVDINGNVDISGTLTIGSAGISEAELEQLDGITAGTVTASKAVVVDSNKDIASFRNVTLTGELDAATLDISSNADIDGTLNVQGETTLQTHLNLGDDDKIKFGDGADLEIYHSGTASIIADTGTGNLVLRADGFYLNNAAGLENMIHATQDGAVTLYHNNAAKLATASGGISVTGEVAATSLDISGDVDIDGTLETDALSINSTAITATATELNILDGVTSTTAELNILDGVTATTAELNLNDTGASVGTVVASKVVTADANKDVASFRNITLTGELDAGSLDVSGDADIDGTLEADAITVNGTALSSVIAGTTVSNATLAATTTVTDSTANTNFPVVFHDESNGLLDDTGALRYNPSTGELLVPKLTVAGTTTTVDTVTMNAENAIVFEGATADAHETTLTIIDPTADRTINLPNVSGTIPVLAAVSTTQISSTPAELNLVDGSSAGTIVNSKAVIYGSSGEVNATTLQIAGTSITSTAAELNILDGVTSTATELNIMDGDTSASSTTLADADRVVTNDNGTMKQVALTDVKTYLSSAGFTTDDPTALAIALG